MQRTHSRRSPRLLLPLLVALLSLSLPGSARGQGDRDMRIPNVVYKYALLDPFQDGVYGQDLVGDLIEVMGPYTNAKEQTGDIKAFDKMPLAHDMNGGAGITGLLVDYGNGCPFNPFPVLPATATHIALLNVTPSASCDGGSALTRTLERLAENNGTGLIAYGDTRDPAVQQLSQTDYAIKIPSYLFQPSLGLFLLAVLNSTNSTASFMAEDRTTVLIPNQPLPPTFALPHDADAIVRIGVRIDIDDLTYTVFPPIWRFAVVSLGIFFSFSIPALLFLRWRAARYAQQFPPPQSPVPAPTINLAELVQKHPTMLFGTIASQYNSNPTCSICLDDLEHSTMVRVLQPCKHAFHPVCVDQWVTEQAAVCPMCRNDLIDKSVVDGDGSPGTMNVGPTAQHPNGQSAEQGRAALTWWRRAFFRQPARSSDSVLPMPAAATQRRQHVSTQERNTPYPWWKNLLAHRSLPPQQPQSENNRNATGNTSAQSSGNIAVDIPLQDRR